MVLVRPRSGGVEDDGFPLLVGGTEHAVVYGMGDDVNAIAVQPKRVMRSLAHELAGNDHGRGRACRAIVGEPAERAARGPEELREVAVLDVVQRHHRRRLYARRRHGQRIVDHVQCRPLLPDALRATCLQRHRDDAERSALRDGRILDLDRRKPFCRVLRASRDEHGVLERPDAPERPNELPRVGLRTAQVTGRQGQQGEADAHARSLLVQSTAPARMPRCPLTTPKTAVLQGIPQPGFRSTSRSSFARFARRFVAPEPIRAPGVGDADERRVARAEAERLWPVSADRSLRLRPGVRGGVGTPVKAVLRKLMRWYVEPLAYDQRSFNAATLRLIDDLQEQVDRLQAELEATRVRQQ